MEPSLKTAVAAVRHDTGLPVAFAGFVDDDARAYAITETAGCATTALNGLLIRAGNGLGGRVLADARIQSVADYLHDGEITHQYDGPVARERLRAIVGAPVIVDGTVRAVLYGALRTTADLGTRTLDIMRETARRAAFDLAVAEATAQQVRTLQTAALLRASHTTPAHPEWEAVRMAHAELRALAGTVGDAGLRHSLDRIASRLTADVAATDRPALTPRELDVLALVAVGWTNAEIGLRLDLRAETVKSYLRAAMRKLGAHRRTEAVARARAAGVLP
ncbi:MAG: helix-turn-helix transcriptional regulator [Actinobacteria bacterium]|nr:helix-turn-helix transcriptional regulator [Actinomycetota bacterium]